LFGVNEPNFYGALDLVTQESLLFIPRLGVEYEVWVGKLKPCEFYRVKYGVDHCHFTDEIVEVLKKRNIVTIHTLHGLNTDSGSHSKPADFPDKDKFLSSGGKEDKTLLHAQLAECRVFKTAREVELLRLVNDISSRAHCQAMREAKTVQYEYELEAIFKYHVLRYGGCRYLAYTCICGSGCSCATLHYGHASAPNDKKIQADDMLLLDMGAEYHGYGSDITCAFPASGKFSPQHKIIYETVLAAQKAVIATMKPGIVWSDMHRLAEGVICDHLIKHGFLIPGDKTRDQLIRELHLVALFFPHGLGHLMGLDVHDVGGYPSGEAGRIQEPGIRKLRTNRILKPGMVLTVEPGVYFIEALLKPALDDPKLRPYLNVKKINEFMGVGGVRLEDDVVVTDTGCENLTKCPREVADVEAVMAGAPWPPTSSSGASASAKALK